MINIYKVTASIARPIDEHPENDDLIEATLFVMAKDEIAAKVLFEEIIEREGDLDNGDVISNHTFTVIDSEAAKTEFGTREVQIWSVSPNVPADQNEITTIPMLIAAAAVRLMANTTSGYLSEHEKRKPIAAAIHGVNKFSYHLTTLDNDFACQIVRGFNGTDHETIARLANYHNAVDTNGEADKRFEFSHQGFKFEGELVSDDFFAERADEDDEESEIVEPGFSLNLRLVGMTTVAATRAIYDDFSNVPIADGGEIQESFHSFSVGDSREDVWRWFENQHPDFSVAEAMIPSAGSGMRP